MMAEKFIQKAIPESHKGLLRKKLHVKKGHNIPEAKLEKAAHKGGTLGHEARLAETLKKLRSRK